MVVEAGKQASEKVGSSLGSANQQQNGQVDYFNFGEALTVDLCFDEGTDHIVAWIFGALVDNLAEICSQTIRRVFYFSQANVIINGAI